METLSGETPAATTGHRSSHLATGLAWLLPPELVESTLSSEVPASYSIWYKHISLVETGSYAREIGKVRRIWCFWAARKNDKGSLQKPLKGTQNMKQGEWHVQRHREGRARLRAELEGRSLAFQSHLRTTPRRSSQFYMVKKETLPVIPLVNYSR